MEKAKWYPWGVTVKSSYHKNTNKVNVKIFGGGNNPINDTELCGFTLDVQDVQTQEAFRDAVANAAEKGGVKYGIYNIKGWEPTESDGTPNPAQDQLNLVIRSMQWAD